MEKQPEKIEFSTVEETTPQTKGSKPLFLVAIILGAVTGFILYKNYAPATTGGQIPQILKTEKVVGSTAKNFKDSAEGVLEKNDSKIITEGTHKLVRDGESQTVYLTSSVVNLDEYVGKKVKAWGETFKGQKAAWLMDVGKLEIQN